MSSQFLTVKKKTQDALISEDMRASSLFRVMSYDEEGNLFHCDDKTLAFGFVCTPLTGRDNNTEQQVHSLLNETFPTNTQMQLI